MYNSSVTPVFIFSDSDREIYEIVNYAVMASSICVFGIGTNVMNILVFYKQGFSNTMNISFFGLAIADLCSLLTLLWCCICVNPLLIKSGVPMEFPEIRHLTGGLPHACCTRITAWITVFITAERCLCITMPLKIKQIITPTKTIVVICVIYVVVMTAFLPEYTAEYIDWKFYPERNKTLLGLVFTSTRKTTAGLTFILYSFLGSTSFIAVAMFTVVLMVQLRRKSEWRRKANVDAARSETMSTRDRKTMNMVVMIASVLIVCFSPGVVVSVITFIEPKFSPVGVYHNEFFVSWTFIFNFDALNSSVNIFLYYKMSTRFRETFNEIFRNNKSPELLQSSPEKSPC